MALSRHATRLASHLHHYALPSHLSSPPLHHPTTPLHCIQFLHHPPCPLSHQPLQKKIVTDNKMGSKRKRSVDDSPLSVSSYGAFSTPEAQSPIPFPQSFDGSMDVDTSSRQTGWDFASASRVKSSDWGNRTRKRFRDNRPDENAIHRATSISPYSAFHVLTAPENTLQKLFSAQRNHPDASPVPSDAPHVQQPMLAISKPQKSTLHSFWKQLPAPPVQPIFSLQPQLQSPAAHLPRCDDCDTPLQSVNDSMDVDMDMDMGGAVESNPFACADCSKNVCGTCAVVSTQRHCLQCATSGRNSRRWW